MNWVHDADKARQQAFGYIEQYNETSDPQLLLNAVSQFRHSLQLAAYNGSRQGRDLAQIGTLLREYFNKTNEFWALDESVSSCRAAVVRTVSREDHDAALLQLAISLYARFQAIDDEAALADALALLRKLEPDRRTPEFLISRHYLTVALHRAYENSHDVALLEEAVRAGRLAADQSGFMQIDLLLSLARCLSSLSYASGDSAFLQEAVATDRRAVELSRQDEPKRQAECLLALARALERLARRTSDAEALEEAAYLADQATLLEEDRVKRMLNNTIATGIFNQLSRRPGYPANEELPAPPPLPEDG